MGSAAMLSMVALLCDASSACGSKTAVQVFPAGFEDTSSSTYVCSSCKLSSIELALSAVMGNTGLVSICLFQVLSTATCATA